MRIRFWPLLHDKQVGRRAAIENVRAGFGLSLKPKHLKYRKSLFKLCFDGFYLCILLLVVLFVLFALLYKV